jgi:uncharacterized protein YkwD
MMRVFLCILLIGMMHLTEGMKAKEEKKTNRFLKKVVLKDHKNYRKLHGAKRLKWDKKLAKTSTSFCKKLAKEDKFEHSNTNAGNCVVCFLPCLNFAIQ